MDFSIFRPSVALLLLELHRPGGHIAGFYSQQWFNTICTYRPVSRCNSQFLPPDGSYLLGKNWLARNYLPGIYRLAKSYPAQPVVTLLSFA